MSIKIVAISDLHGYLPKIETPADIMLLAGDLIPFDIQFNILESKKWFENEFTNWINELPVESVYMIAGNHDFYLRSTNKTNIGLLRQATNFKLNYLFNNHLVYYDRDAIQWKIFGTPYCSIFGNWPFMIPDDLLEKKFEDIPEDVDIIISHDPPFGISDADVILDTTKNPSRSFMHLGNKPLANKIKDIDYKLLVCGHIHSGDHNLVNKCVNVSIKNEFMAPVNPPFYYTLEK